MQREVILVVGQTGSGKTTWAREYAKTKTRVLLADAGFNEYGIEEAESFPDLLDTLQRNFFRVSYSPRYWEWPHIFEAARISGEEKGPLHLFVEEAYRVGNTRDVVEYDDAVNQGRHWGLSLVALSTRAAKMPTDLKAQITRVIAYKQVQPIDIDYLADIMGDTAFDIPSLNQFEFYDWKHTGEISKSKINLKGKNSNDKTVNSSKLEDARLPTQHLGGGDPGNDHITGSEEDVPGS